MPNTQLNCGACGEYYDTRTQAADGLHDSTICSANDEDNRLWLGTGGSVTCYTHAGAYLTAAIDNNPQAAHHVTPLDWWVEYSLRELPCETCTPWHTITLSNKEAI